MKANTQDLRTLEPSVAATVAVEVMRGWVAEINVEARPPSRVATGGPPEILATARDVPTDSLIEALTNMGL